MAQPCSPSRSSPAAASPDRASRTARGSSPAAFAQGRGRGFAGGRGEQSQHLRAHAGLALGAVAHRGDLSGSTEFGGERDGVRGAGCPPATGCGYDRVAGDELAHHLGDGERGAVRVAQHRRCQIAVDEQRRTASSDSGPSTTSCRAGGPQVGSPCAHGARRAGRRARRRAAAAGPAPSRGAPGCSGRPTAGRRPRAARRPRSPPPGRAATGQQQRAAALPVQDRAGPGCRARARRRRVPERTRSGSPSATAASRASASRSTDRARPQASVRSGRNARAASTGSAESAHELGEQP